MKVNILQKLFFGMSFALIFGTLAGVISVRAGGEMWQEPTPDDCQGCHPIVHEYWAIGGHGVADVSCATCHYPPTDHPDEVMPTDVSSRLCGQCHIATAEEWATSIHGQEDMTCVRCHNTHTTHLKTADVQSLCQNCHSERVHFFSLSMHASEGLLCTDCHMQMVDSEIREGPEHRVHTFIVDLQSCTTCHGEELHNPSQTDPCDPEELAKAEEQGLDDYPCEAAEIIRTGLGMPDEEALTSEPEGVSVSPAGFAIVGTLIGMAAGMILAPWLEKWYRQLKQ